VATSLAAASRTRAALAQARSQGLGVFLDPEPWRNQLPPGHAQRRAPFSHFDFALDGGAWSPRQEPAAEELEALPRAWLAAQAEAGATSLLIPGHVYPDLTGHGRCNDLLFARRACDVADRDRPLFAQLNIYPANLRNRDIAWLADAYAELPVDGYWLGLVKFTQSASQYLGVRALATALRQRTGARVILAGLGRLWPGALADGVDSICFGYERLLFSFPPPDVPPPARRSGRIHIYHPAVFIAPSFSEEARHAQRYLFEQFPCYCAWHPPYEPPITRAVKLRHNAWWIARELDWATTPAAQRLESLEERIARATALRADLGMSPLPTAWREIARRASNPPAAPALF
jgi:hypothetical protein